MGTNYWRAVCVRQAAYSDEGCSSSGIIYHYVSALFCLALFLLLLLLLSCLALSRLVVFVALRAQRVARRSRRREC